MLFFNEELPFSDVSRVHSVRERSESSDDEKY
jgi:hypothetical protein